MSFVTGTQAELLYILSSPVTKNTYTTQAAITGVAGTNTVASIPAGFLLNNNPNPLGRALRLEVFGTIANTAAATFALALNINPTLATATGNVAVAAAFTPTASVTAPFWLQASIVCTAFTSSASTYQINGTYRQESAATGSAPNATGVTSGFAGSITGLDPRVTQYVELFGTWSASAAGNTTTVQQMYLWGLN